MGDGITKGNRGERNKYDYQNLIFIFKDIILIFKVANICSYVVLPWHDRQSGGQPGQHVSSCARNIHNMTEGYATTFTLHRYFHNISK